MSDATSKKAICNSIHTGIKFVPITSLITANHGSLGGLKSSPCRPEIGQKKLTVI